MKLFLFAVLFFTSSTANAEWIVRKDHSELFFNVTYINESEVTGRFKSFKGEIDFDEMNINPRYVQIEIEVSSIDTGNTVRDGHLKANDFLMATRYPTIQFKSKNISKVSERNFLLAGNLELRGISQPVDLTFEIRPDTTDTWGYKSKFVKFKGSLSRKKFGINWNKTLENNFLMLSDRVNFWGTIQLQEKGAFTPSSKHLIPDTTYIREREKLLRGEISEKEFSSIFPALKQKNYESSGKIGPSLELQINSLKLTPRQASENGMWWWLSFLFIALIGFLGTLSGILYAKRLVLETYPDKYNEIGWLGYLTDLVGIFFLLIFTLAFWQVGWGV